jgi:transposase-like protein
MAKQRRSFSTSTEFKREAASLVVDQGYSVAEAARAVDVGPSPLRRWVITGLPSTVRQAGLVSDRVFSVPLDR